MYRIALIQNQSEMSHYGYADARDFLSKFNNFKIILYTAQNINQLVIDINIGNVDSVIVASHATNDITIRHLLFSNEFKISLEKILSRNGGILILHQLRLGENALENPKDGELTFLPEKLNGITAMARKKDESYLSGTLNVNKFDTNNYCINFPNVINVEELYQNSIHNVGVKGTYWHYWENVDTGVWDVILQDDSFDIARPLILASKELESGRIALSSMVLDWQKHYELFENLVLYVVEGKHQICFLKSNQDIRDIDTQYFVEMLKSKKIPFTNYNLPADQEEFNRNVQLNIHSIAVASEKTAAILDPSLRDSLNKKIEAGRLKIISIDNGKFTVEGQERDALGILYSLQIEAIGEMNHGYIDGSFWGTVEALQVFEHVREANKIKPAQLEKIFEKIVIHDKNGSYDGVFGATCALLWLKSTYYGVEDEQTQNTLKWLINGYGDYEKQEKLLLLQTMYSTKNFALKSEESILSDMQEILHALDLTSIKEINGELILKCANILKDINSVKKILNSLSNQQKNGLWIDAATTSLIVTGLIDSRNILLEMGEDVTQLDNLLFSAVTAIHQNAEKFSDSGRPWGKKISINLRCIEAILKFDSLISLPISEVLGSINAYTNVNNRNENLQTSLGVLSTISQDYALQAKENERLKQEQAKNETDLKDVMSKAKKFLIVSWVSSVVAVLFLYITIMLAVFINTASGEDTFTVFMLNNIELHIALIALLSGVMPFAVKASKINVKEKNTNEEDN